MNIDYIDNMLFMIEKIKDLTKLGRDKIIIVDNLTFKLQRSNSIWINSFYGDCIRITLKILSVRKNIFDSEETIRDSLRKEQRLIINKITSNLSFKLFRLFNFVSFDWKNKK